ncbi:MAG: sigma-54-dependent Fis family transcriptional regulator [Nitrospirae bacterium]|nr:sigma-54-dependent Fis family transcriptional regulator [Nitrospirota bacterium]
MFARAIHEWSPRSKRPFVIVDTPAISDTLFESDLFGHVRGAFTGAINDRKGYFEMAHRGTLFLDEIGDLSGRIQAGLLGVLQRYEIKRVGSSSPIKVDVRVIAATNRNLSDDIDRGTFREDLYYRLNVLPVELPPLRERREDIEPLAHYFLGKYCAENGISNLPIKGITSEALGRLKAHSWRGNIRELENVIARAVTMAKGKWITEADLNINHFTAAFLSLLGKNEFSIDKTARILGESRGTVAHQLKGICLEQLVRSKGDIYKASLALSGGRPESLNRVRQRMEEYYGNLLNVIQQYEDAETAITECRRRFKNLKGKYFTAVEDLVKKHFEKNKEI